MNTRRGRAGLVGLACMALLAGTTSATSAASKATTKKTAKSSSAKTTKKPTATTAKPMATAAPVTTASATVRSGTLKVGAAADVTTLDPHAGTSGYDYFMLYPMYDTLIDYDPKTLAPKPGLALSWTFDDPTTLTLKLRPNVKFQDGTPFNAAAVVFNANRVKGDGSNIKADLATVSSVTAVDDLTVRYKLTDPNSALVGILADRAGMMVSPAAAQGKSSAEYSRAPVGAGPFRYVDYNRGSVLKYEAFKDYWDAKLPYLSAMEFRILTDGDARINGLITGQLDFVTRIEPQSVDKVRSAKNIDTEQYVGIGDAKIIYLNTKLPPFNEKKARQAINYAMDREALTKAATFGTGEPAFMPIPSGHWAYQKDLAPGYKFDPAKAKQLLKEAGFKDGYIEFDLVHQPDATDTRIAEIFQSQMAKAGINVNLVPVELTQSVREYFTDGKYQAGHFGWTGRPDPSMTFLQIFDSKAFFNAGKYNMPGFNDLLSQAAATSDQAARSAAYNKIVQLEIDESIIAPMFFRATIDAMSNKVSGYTSNILSKPKFTQIKLAS